MVVILFILLLLLYLNLKSPTYYVVFYLFLTTKCLGFFSLSSILISGFDIGFFLINVLTLFLSFINFYKLNQFKALKSLFILVLILLMYGIIKPIFDENSNFVLSIMASKDFLNYSILFFLFAKFDRIDEFLLRKFVLFLAIYLSVCLIIGQFFTAFVPPFYFSESVLRVFYPTYITLGLYISVIDSNNITIKLNKVWFLRLLLVIGLIFTGYFNLTITTFLGLFFLYFGVKNGGKIRKSFFVFYPILCILFSLMLAISNHEVLMVLEREVTNILFSKDSALSSRDIYNEFRWEAINKQPYFGYGFIHHSAEIVKMLAHNQENRFMRSFSVIDSGYVDFIIKFGFIGLVAFISIVGSLIFKIFVNRYRAYYWGLSIFILQMFLVNYTWSMFTFQHGIIVFSLSLFIIFKNINKKC